MKNETLKKRITAYGIILAIAVLLELFVGNWPHWRLLGTEEIVLAQNIALENGTARIFGGTAEETADGAGMTVETEEETAEGTAGNVVDGIIYYTAVCTVDAEVKNVHVKMDVTGGDLGHAYVILTDEGDKYEYAMPEFAVCSDVLDTEYQNIYPFGKVHTIQAAVRLSEGGSAKIQSISVNSPKPVDIKWIRMIAVCLILLFGYLVFTDSGLHRTYYDPACTWQRIVTALVILALIFLGKYLTTEDPVLINSPWPHHRQYQELAHSLSAGEVKLAGHTADEALAGSGNPYDTIALQVEGVAYDMDYAYYGGHYYVYFGIVPELLFYYPYYKLTGNDLPNYKVMFMEYVIFVIGAYLAVHGLAGRYIHRIPYFFYIGIYAGLVLLANFVYLAWRTDIYNVPIMGAAAFSFAGIGLWLHASGQKAEDRAALGRAADQPTWHAADPAGGHGTAAQAGGFSQKAFDRRRIIRICLLALGSLCMALVAGCRPQFLILSGLGVILFLAGGRTEKEAARTEKEAIARTGAASAQKSARILAGRTLFTKETVPETIAFAVPYLCVAAVVGWYNYARFGSIFDFGATYSLTTNDMNHRGFNFSRLARSLYCFLLQPAVINTDFPFLQPSNVDGSYMGKFLSEFLYGGVLTANPFFLSIWLWLIKGLKRPAGETAAADSKRPAEETEAADPKKSASRRAINMPSVITLYLVLSALLVAAFDANAAGVLYRYACDFVPALALAAAFLWMLYLDREKEQMDYTLVSRLMYICLVCSLFYTLLSFCAGGNSVCLENDNVRLFYRIAGYFKL